jgi:hypothetical protein
MVQNFTGTYPEPIIQCIEGRVVVRDDLMGGSKARAGEYLIATTFKKEIVYVCPRFGFASISLIDLCKKYNKTLHLFMPACKEISDHQAYCIENGAQAHFFRIAAMPNLNKTAELYADSVGARFIPLGLKHPLVTAMIVKTASQMPEPESFWTAFSTGVLNRALQIAWPNAKANAVAVSRNIHHGERGRCNIVSSSRLFSQDAIVRPPFPSASNYDAKVWEHVQEGELFWNVAGEVTHTLNKSQIKSNKPWHV